MTVPTITLNGMFKNAAGDPEVGTVEQPGWKTRGFVSVHLNELLEV